VGSLISVGFCNNTNVDSFSGKVFKLLVANEKTTLQVHEKVLSSSSEFFKRAVKAEWAESRPDPDSIDMSEHSLEDVKLYLHWLYERTLPLAHDAHGIGTYRTLTNAYVFGEKVVDVQYKNCVLLSLIAAMKQIGSYPEYMAINTIYEKTPVGSPARRLMRDIYASRADGKGAKWQSQFNHLNQEVLVDIITEMSKVRLALGTSVWHKKPGSYVEGNST
jgi:hypothetical protein